MMYVVLSHSRKEKFEIPSCLSFPFDFRGPVGQSKPCGGLKMVHSKLDEDKSERQREKEKAMALFHSDAHPDTRLPGFTRFGKIENDISNKLHLYRAGSKGAGVHGWKSGIRVNPLVV